MAITTASTIVLIGFWVVTVFGHGGSSKAGKESTITLLGAGDFVGEESVAGRPGLRLATANAITACIALKMQRNEMIRVLHEEHFFSDLFVAFLLARVNKSLLNVVLHDQTKGSEAAFAVDNKMVDARSARA